tara:strand:- start:112 stop:909 length:798 start_codon:yes stop_codon:yes gene_type:complete
MSLTNKKVKDTYLGVIKTTDNTGLGFTIKQLKSGSGSDSCMYLSDTILKIQPTRSTGTADNVNVFQVATESDTNVFKVDTVNQLVYGSGNILNTQYANFGIGSAGAAQFDDDTHHALVFGGGGYGGSMDSPNFGTSTDPATTFTTSSANHYRAGDLANCIWYIHDDISIDAVKSFEGADAATGDTTRMHLFSYDFTSGATNCLTNGALVAHNSDVTNAGDEQPYLSSWTVDTAAVASGKVILAFFKSDSINSDYSINIQIKYHLT